MLMEVITNVGECNGSGWNQQSCLHPMDWFAAIRPFPSRPLGECGVYSCCTGPAAFLPQEAEWHMLSKIGTPGVAHRCHTYPVDGRDRIATAGERRKRGRSSTFEAKAGGVQGDKRRSHHDDAPKWYMPRRVWRSLPRYPSPLRLALCWGAPSPDTRKRWWGEPIPTTAY